MDGEHLAKLIEARLLGVRPEDQDLELDDDDYRLIVDALRSKMAGEAEIARLKIEAVGLIGEAVRRKKDADALAAALKGVVRVADRDTVEFNAARAALTGLSPESEVVSHDGPNR